MIRLVTLFLVILLAGWSTLWFLDRPGEMTIVWQDWEIRTTVAFALLALLIFVLALIFLSRLVFSLIRVPGQVARHTRQQNREQGFEAISKGLIAIATGDLKLAKRYSRRASALVPEQPLTKVLLAQKAQLEGNQDDAQLHFEAMLKSPETELLGRQGLAQHAIKRGDRQSALAHAHRAFQLRPKVKWAYSALLEHLSKASAWDEALATIEKGRQSGHITNQDADFKKAVFLTAKAYAALENDHRNDAENLALQAQRLVPGFTPAAILAARILMEKGAQWKASGILEEAWRAEPHPAIIETYAAIKPDESMRLRARRLPGLVELRPDPMESLLLRARIAINTREWGEARSILDPVIRETPTPRVCALMAEVEQGEHNNIGAAREWMARAVSAPSEPEWLRTDFHFTASEWGELARELTEWPPQFSERTFEKTIRLAPIHDHSKILGEEEPPQDAASPAEEIIVPDDEISIETVSGAPLSRDADEKTIQPARTYISPLRSKRRGDSLKTRQTPVAPPSMGRIDKARPAPPKQKSVPRTAGKHPPQGASLAPKPKVADNRAFFSLSHQPDDPGPSD